MAGAIKHMDRSHRSHNKYKPFGDFDRKAKVKLYKKENKNWLSQFLGNFKKGDR